jgi:transposase
MKGGITMLNGKVVKTKNTSLREHGALNPRPESISDELFAEYDFFDPRDLVQVKYEMLRRVHKNGWSVAHSARTFGFSRVAFYRAQAAFRQSGLSGLLRQRTGPRGPHKLSETVMNFIEKAMTEEASLSTRDLARLVKQKFGILIHHRTIERALTRRKKKCL